MISAVQVCGNEGHTYVSVRQLVDVRPYSPWGQSLAVSHCISESVRVVLAGHPSRMPTVLGTLLFKEVMLVAVCFCHNLYTASQFARVTEERGRLQEWVADVEWVLWRYIQCLAYSRRMYGCCFECSLSGSVASA